MSTTSGFSQIVICDAGTLATAPTRVSILNITRNEDLKTTPKTVKIDRDEMEFTVLENLLLSAEPLQNNLTMFHNLIYQRGGNCDVQIIALDGSVFKFLAASNPIGIEPKLIYNDDYRIIQVDLEASFPSDVWDAIVLSAQSDVAVTVADTKDADKVRTPYPGFLQSPSSVEIFGSYQSRNLTISPKRKSKSIVGTSFNISLFDRMIVEAALKMEDVSFQDYYNQKGKGRTPELKWKEMNDSIHFDEFDFAEGLLSQKVEYNNSGTKTEMSVAYKGAAIIENITLNTGEAKGGDAADATLGGTMSFAA